MSRARSLRHSQIGIVAIGQPLKTIFGTKVRFIRRKAVLTVVKPEKSCADCLP